MHRVSSIATTVFSAFALTVAAPIAFARPSEFRESTAMVEIYREAIEARYYNDWYAHVQDRQGSKRAIYLEAEGKLPWVGIMSFDCEPGEIGDWVSLTRFEDPEHPTHHDPSVLLSGIDIENWKQSLFEEDVLAAKPTSIIDIPPYEVFVISRFVACR